MESANERINRVNGFLKNNFEGEKYDEVAKLLTTAESIQVAEAMIGLTKQHSPPINEVQSSTGKTIHDLVAMNHEKDENGHLRMNTDSAFREQYNRLRAELEAKNPV